MLIGWRSKIGWSDWPKLIREVVFYPNFGRQYLGFLWLVLCDSGLVWKPLIWTIGTKKECSIWVISWRDIAF